MILLICTISETEKQTGGSGAHSQDRYELAEIHKEWIQQGRHSAEAQQNVHESDSCCCQERTLLPKLAQCLTKKAHSMNKESQTTAFLT